MVAAAQNTKRSWTKAYAILAWISVLFPEFALYIVVFMDMYEVFAIFHFMELMKAYMGGWHSTVRRMQTQPPVRLLVFQIRAQEYDCCETVVRVLYLTCPHRNTLFVIHCFVVQFIIIKPSISLLQVNEGFFVFCVCKHLHIVQAGLEHFELLTRDINLASPFLYLVALKGLSLAGAMIALIVFYRFSRDILSSYNIIKKFLIVKLVIFLNILYVSQQQQRKRENFIDSFVQPKLYLWSPRCTRTDCRGRKHVVG